MKIVTGNDLVTGDVIWWTGQGWSRHVADAVDVGHDGDCVAAREEAALRVNGPIVIEATASDAGPIPAHIKDRIRAAGPTVRPDLAIRPDFQIEKR
ncbi:MAG: hypothetical protein JWR77_550 [Rhizorhabdus sp.]|nr:hypothetical protein [Rhizorhabdus sp.]